MSDVHRLSGGKPEHTRFVHYPFCRKKGDLGKAIKERRLHHSGKKVIGAIEKTALYKGGNDGLCAIHDLNILDKHQTLVPTIALASLDWPL